MPRPEPPARPPSFLIFLGTGGGRFATFRQARATGGLWFQTPSGSLHLDPGPGALIRVLKAGLDPRNLHAIILSHRHLDHCADVNVMIEAMTNGGFEHRGIVYAPADAIEGDDPVVLRYCRKYLDGIRTLSAGAPLTIAGLTITPIVSYPHGGVETFRFVVEFGGQRLALFVDGSGFQGADLATGVDLLVAYVVMKDPIPEIDHFSLVEVQELVRITRPKSLILTHFGMNFIRQKPWEIAASLTQSWGLPVIAAWDNMAVNLATMQVIRARAKRSQETDPAP